MCQYDRESKKAEEFINHEEILETLRYAEENKHNEALIAQILEKAKKRKGLEHREAMVLLDCDIEEKNQEIYALAEQIKKDFYGNRIVMFAPLYLSNYCVNGCVYCILSGSTTKWPVLPNTTNAESSENIFRFPSVAVRDYTIRPVRKFRIENGSKHPVFDTRIFQVQLTQKLFAVLTACMSVSRTGTFGNRELIFMPESDHIRFIDKKQRTDHSQIHLI